MYLSFAVNGRNLGVVGRQHHIFLFQGNPCLWRHDDVTEMIEMIIFADIPWKYSFFQTKNGLQLGFLKMRIRYDQWASRAKKPFQGLPGLDIFGLDEVKTCTV